MKIERADRELHQATRPYAQQSSARSWWHVGSTFALLACALAGAAVAPWWPVRLIASTLGALLLVRAFILYHDFMHGAILPGSKLARAIFYTYAAVNLTPPRSWRDSHNFHHANVGRIAGSNVGAYPLMTTEMWRKASRSQRIIYRVTRHPLTILGAYLTIFFFSVTLLPLLKRPSRHWDSALALLAHGTAFAALWLLGGFDAAFFVSRSSPQLADPVLSPPGCDGRDPRVAASGRHDPAAARDRRLFPRKPVGRCEGLHDRLS